MAEPFAMPVAARASARDLLTVLAVAERLGPESEIAILGSPHGDTGADPPWLAFDVSYGYAGGRTRCYAIWRATGKLSAVGDDGAVGEDPIDPAEVRP